MAIRRFQVDARNFHLSTTPVTIVSTCTICNTKLLPSERDRTDLVATEFSTESVEQTLKSARFFCAATRRVLQASWRVNGWSMQMLAAISNRHYVISIYNCQQIFFTICTCVLYSADALDNHVNFYWRYIVFRLLIWDRYCNEWVTRWRLKMGRARGRQSDDWQNKRDKRRNVDTTGKKKEKRKIKTRNKKVEETFGGRKDLVKQVPVHREYGVKSLDNYHYCLLVFVLGPTVRCVCWGGAC